MGLLNRLGWACTAQYIAPVVKIIAGECSLISVAISGAHGRVGDAIISPLLHYSDLWCNLEYGVTFLLLFLQCRQILWCDM